MADLGARQTAWLLSQLVQCDPASLGTFRDTHLRSADVALADLTLVRDLLVELGRALQADVPHLWTRVRRAADALGVVPIDGEATRTASRTSQPSLPFRGSAAPPPAVSSTLEPNHAFGATAPLAARPAVDAALPFDGLTGPDAVVRVGTLSLTLEHHAELFAARARRPAAWEALRARYGIVDDAAFEALDRAWQARFAREPELQRRWVVAYQRALEPRGAR
jgi:hypothetical protein